MTTKSMRTKRRLAQALEELLYEMPFEKVTVRAVVERAGTNRQTFYYHFETLDELVSFLCTERLVPINEAVNSTEGARELFRSIVKQVEKAQGVLAPLLAGVGRPAMKQLFFDGAFACFMKEAHQIVKRKGAEIDEKAVERTALYCQYATATILIDWINGDCGLGLDSEDLADFLFQSFENAIIALVDNEHKSSSTRA